MWLDGTCLAVLKSFPFLPCDQCSESKAMDPQFKSSMNEWEWEGKLLNLKHILTNLALAEQRDTPGTFHSTANQVLSWGGCNQLWWLSCIWIPPHVACNLKLSKRQFKTNVKTWGNLEFQYPIPVNTFKICKWLIWWNPDGSAESSGTNKCTTGQNSLLYSRKLSAWNSAS